MRTLALGALLLAAALAAVLAGWPPAGLGLRIAFVLASAPAVGAVLLLAIARLTGATWPIVGNRRWLVWSIPFGVLAMLAPTGAALPQHLALWSHPLFVAGRAAAALAALAWAGHRLRGGAGATAAGMSLALYAVFVTPIAADWLLPTAPGHPVSAVGMLLFLLHFAAGCALALTHAEGRARRDLALLLVAACIGLCYLVFMDYLITWFGNLPARVPFYLARSGWLAAAALMIGVAGPIAATALRREGVAAACAGVGLALFALWWIGGGVVAALLTLALLALAGLGMRGRARG